MKLACLVLPLVGCVDVTPTPLASLANRQLHVGGGPNADGVVVSLSWDEMTVEECPVLPASFRATANEMLLDVVMNDYVTADVWCLHPPLQFETFVPAPAKTTMLVLEDESLAITADLGDLSVRRTGTLAAEGPVARGSELSVAWSPSSDLIRYTPRVLLEQGDSVYAIPHAIDGANVRFTVPADGRYLPGDAILRVVMIADSDSLPCSNAQCTLSAARQVFHSVTFE